MAEYIMIMKGSSGTADWGPYIQSLVDTGKFRGGSAFGNGRCITLAGSAERCVGTGYMRFEADSIEEVQALLPGNPVYDSGGAVELHELVVG